MESHSDEGMKKKKPQIHQRSAIPKDNEQDDTHGSVSHRVFSFLSCFFFSFFSFLSIRRFLSCFFLEPIRVPTSHGFHSNLLGKKHVIVNEDIKRKENIIIFFSLKIWILSSFQICGTGKIVKAMSEDEVGTEGERGHIACRGGREWPL